MLRTCFPYRSLCSLEPNRIWAVSEESMKRYVLHASEKCIQDLLSASITDAEDGWRASKTRRGVEIWQKLEGPLVTVLGRKHIEDFPSRFKDLATAINTAKRWDPYLVQGQRLKSLQENVDIVRLVFSAGSGPLFKNREFIVYERKETMEDGTMVVAIASLPSEMAAGILPPSSNLIRGVLQQSGWVIEKVEQNNSSTVTYMAQLDPLGWLPKWLVNILNVDLVLVIDDLLAGDFE